MKTRPIITLCLLLSACSILIAFLPAHAQLGVGFGVGSGFGAGPALWSSGFGHIHSGNFYGAAFSIAPGNYTAPITQMDHVRSPAKPLAANQVPGSLDGYISLCEPSPPTTSNLSPNQAAEAPKTTDQTVTQNSASAAKGQPLQARIKQTSSLCPTNADAMQTVVVLARPYGMSQWIGTKPDANGHYHLTLMPGGYLVQASSSVIQNQRPREIIIEPGQTRHQNFQLGP